MLAIAGALQEHGLADAQIKFELFASGQPGRAKQRAVEHRRRHLELDHRGDGHARRRHPQLPHAEGGHEPARRRAREPTSTRPTPARPASARPAAPRCSRARSRWPSTTRSRTTRCARATCSPASASRSATRSSSATTSEGDRCPTPDRPRDHADRGLPRPGRRPHLAGERPRPLPRRAPAPDGDLRRQRARRLRRLRRHDQRRARASPPASPPPASRWRRPTTPSASSTLMGDFGADEGRYAVHHPWADRLPRDADIGQARHGGDMRLAVFHYPLEGWIDAVVMNVLQGLAADDHPRRALPRLLRAARRDLPRHRPARAAPHRARHRRPDRDRRHRRGPRRRPRRRRLLAAEGRRQLRRRQLRPVRDAEALRPPPPPERGAARRLDRDRSTRRWPRSASPEDSP